jgi:glycosyltransferase involved in cell wall biosynthesis
MGASRSMMQIVDYLLDKKVDIKLIVPDEGPLTNELKQKNIEYKVIKQIWPKDGEDKATNAQTVVDFFRSVAEIKSAIQSWDCDVVYSNTITMMGSALAASMLEIPHVWHIREVQGASHGWNLILNQEDLSDFIAEFSNQVIFISEALKDEYQSIPNSHVVLNYVDTSDYQAPYKLDKKNISKKVDVALPFYNDPMILDCLTTLVKHKSDLLNKVMIINDKCPDEQLLKQVKQFASKHKFIEVIDNEENMGFVYNCNLAMEKSGDNDIVLLNTDTLVTENWLEHLFKVAHSSDKIGTVTPLSNNNNRFSIPKQLKHPSEFNEDDNPEYTAKLVAKFSPYEYLEAPVAHGFCMFIKRATIKKVGNFDYETFGRGYGEETDFSLRVRRADLINALACRAYVYHKGMQSFTNEEKLEKVQKHSAIIHKRYPEFREISNRFFNEENPLEDIRRIIGYFKDNDLQEDLNYFCTVGQVTKAKGVHQGIEALAKISENEKDVNMLIVGPVNPDYEVELRNLISKHGLENKVHFIGFLDNPFSIVKNAFAFLNAAEFEAFGRSTAEAMQLGTPAIGVNAGGTPELIKNGSGLLFDYGDIEQLQKHVLYLANNKKEAAKITSKAAVTIDKITSLEKYAGSVYNIISEASKEKVDKKINTGLANLLLTIGDFEHRFQPTTTSEIDSTSARDLFKISIKKSTYYKYLKPFANLIAKIRSK